MKDSSKKSWGLIIIAGLIWALFGFLVGGFIASLTTPKTAGLAGAANVFLYGLLGTTAGIGFIIYLTGRATNNSFRRSILIGLAAVITLGGILFLKNQKDPDPTIESSTSDLIPKISSQEELTLQESPTISSDSAPAPNRAQSTNERVIGLGFANMPINNQISRLDFYADPYALSPIDSFVLAGERLTYAPAYLMPYYQKLDYNQFTLRWIAVGQDRVKVELNAQLGRAAWVNKNQLELSYWPEFLIEVFAVAALDPASNPLRIKAQDNAATISIPAEVMYLQASQATEEWLFVEFWMEGQGESLGEGGWIRWRNGDELLVKWDYRL